MFVDPKIIIQNETDKAYLTMTKETKTWEELLRKELHLRHYEVIEL